MFRIIEPASGTIIIDGVDITALGLHDRKRPAYIYLNCVPKSRCQVRSAISIVPQSPDLFEGTIRENIDPLGEYQDANIWAALEQVMRYISFYYLTTLTKLAIGASSFLRGKSPWAPRRIRSRRWIVHVARTTTTAVLRKSFTS